MAAYREPCGWQALRIPRCPEPNLRRNETCDLAVIGAGFTGFAAARTWADARPSDRVAVVDAGIVGDGAAARGTGLLSLVQLTEADDGLSPRQLFDRAQLLRECFAWLNGIVEAWRCPGGLRQTGLYQAVRADVGGMIIERLQADLALAGCNFELLDRAALAERLGSRYYGSGVYVDAGWQMQPAALVRGLADSLPGNIVLYEETPVTSLRREGEAWRVESADGSLLADRVMIADSALAARLRQGYDCLAPIYRYAGLTPVLPPALAALLGSDTDWGLLSLHPLGTSLRRTEDDRLLILSTCSYGREHDRERVAARLQRKLADRFPGLATALGTTPFEYVWGGIAGWSGNGAPLWGEFQPGLLFAVGCCGNGVLHGTLFGRLLALWALGEDVPDAAALFGQPPRLPPEPLRRLQFLLAAARAED